MMMHETNGIILGVLHKQELKDEKAANVYVLKVAKNAAKKKIKDAFEIIFGKNVASVNTSIVKARKSFFKRVPGKTKAYKKAFVTLKNGESLDDAI